MASPNADMVDETQTLNTSQSEQKTEAQGGEIYGGPSGTGRLWSMYLTETEKQDIEMVERWKGEADSALIFGGLFSAVVTVSLVESYKWLSPNPGDDTVKLLSQISRQLVNISNGIPLESISAENSQPFRPTTSVLLVNVTWLFSVVLCLACSVIATLIRQWAQRYLALTQGRGAPYERGHLRTFMFNGLRRFKPDLVSQLMAMSLHLSILLYCVGLLGYIFSINTGFGFAAFIYLALFNLMYSTLTVLPLFFFDCPFGTPYSAFMWSLSHVSLLGYFSTIRRIKDLFHSRGPAQWKEKLEKRINRHRQWFVDGLERTVELCATEAPQAVDADALEWTLTALVETNSDKEIENFAAWVPDLFDTHPRSDASETISPPTSDQPPTNPVFGFRLYHLLKTCILGTSALTEVERKRRLRVCLKCLWCWIKAYNQNSVSLPSYFPLPSPEVTLRLRTEQDPTAGIVGRCFAALVAKKLAADVNSRHSSDIRVREAKLRCLSAILGGMSTEAESFLSQPDAIGLANFVSLISREMDTLVTEKVPSEVLDILRTTIDILLAGDFLTSPDADLPPNLVARFDETYSDAERLQAPNWLMDRLMQISRKLSVVSAARRARDGLLDNV